MKHIVLIAIAICAGTSVHAPELKTSKCVSHPLHDAAGVSSPFLDQTKGNGLAYELKMLKDSIDKKKRAKKRRHGWILLTLSIILMIIDPLLLIWIPPLIALSIISAFNPIQTIILVPIFYGMVITTTVFVFPVCIVFTLYAFCKGCTLLAQGYGRRRKYQVKTYDVSLI